MIFRDRRDAGHRLAEHVVALGLVRPLVLVDDGLATGVTARAAVLALRRLGPRRLVLAVPVAAPDRADALAAEGLEVVCLSRPSGFRAVGSWYEHFDQTSDDEVVELLAAAHDPRGSAHDRA